MSWDLTRSRPSHAPLKTVWRDTKQLPPDGPLGCSGNDPRFGFYENYTPEIKQVTLPGKELVGFTRRLDFEECNNCAVQHSSCMAMKDEILLDFFKEVNFACQRIYSLFSVKDVDGQQGKKSVYYSTAIDKERKHEIQGAERSITSRFLVVSFCLSPIRGALKSV